MNAPLIVVAGPTGSGKSGLAIDLALAFGGEVLNCDSVQVYRRFDIGTAKLAEAERQGIPHHLIDIVDPTSTFTAGDYLRLGRAVLAEIRSRDRIPIVAGGTGLYLRALLEGLFQGPRRSESLRTRLNDLAARKGPAHLHRLLRRVDEDSAVAISPNDRPKMIRALEVYFLTSLPISRHFKLSRDRLEGFEVLQIGLNPPRQLLHRLIDRRLEEMFAAGLVEEVAAIRLSFGDHLKPLQSIGYSQTLAFLRGEMSLADAISRAQLETHQYAKRQLTWFRRDKSINWFEGFGSDPVVRAAARGLALRFLSKFPQRMLRPQPSA